MTNEGTSDWAHWGSNNSISSFDHKAAGGTQISVYTSIGGAAPTAYNNGAATGFTWTDNATTPTSASTAQTGVIVSGPLGNGFQITAPADTTTRTLRVYVAAYGAQGQLTATLGAGSTTVATYSGATFDDYGTVTNKVYVLTYNGSASGQTLTVRFTKTGDNTGSGNNGGLVALQAATLRVGTT